MFDNNSLIVGPQDCMWRSGHDGAGPDPTRFFCDVIGPAPSCHLYRAVADTEAEARGLAFRKAAQAIETRRAETARLGAQHESAVASGDAPVPHPHPEGSSH